MEELEKVISRLYISEKKLSLLVWLVFIDQKQNTFLKHQQSPP